jgi:DUF177 domain-containing protein
MNPFRIDVADLLTHPGARRALRLDGALADLGAQGAHIGSPVDLDLMLERVPEGIVARGTVAARFDAECGVCLQPISGAIEVEASELYEDHPVDGETYALEGHVIDLEQLVRDALLLELPLAPTCSSVGEPECTPDVPVGSDVVVLAGGAPSQRGGPDDDDDLPAPADPRWAVLSQLEL